MTTNYQVGQRVSVNLEGLHPVAGPGYWTPARIVEMRVGQVLVRVESTIAPPAQDDFLVPYDRLGDILPK